MNILQIIPVFHQQFGGPVSVVKSISKELAKKHQVNILTTNAISNFEDDSEIPKTYVIDGYNVLSFPRIFKKYGFFISPMMRNYLDNNIEQYDIVHLHSWRNYQDLITFKIAKKHDIPYVIEPHGTLIRVGKKYRKILYDTVIGRTILESSYQIIALSDTEKNHAMKIGISENKITIIPNGIDYSKYKQLVNKNIFKKHYSIDNDKFLLLYLGRIHFTKGIKMLLQAFSLLKHKYKMKDCILILIGPDDGFLEESIQICSELNISEDVLFTGFINEEMKINAFLESKLFITPSFYGFPVTFLESCAMGIPIITTFFGDTLEWIHMNVGLVTEPTPNSLAKGINQILGNVDLYSQLSTNCKKTIEDVYSIQRVCEKLEHLYLKCIS